MKLGSQIVGVANEENTGNKMQQLAGIHVSKRVSDSGEQAMGSWMSRVWAVNKGHRSDKVKKPVCAAYSTPRQMSKIVPSLIRFHAQIGEKSDGCK